MNDENVIPADAQTYLRFSRLIRWMLLGLIAAAALRYLLSAQAFSALEQDTAAQAVRTVSVVQLKPPSGQRQIVLPATLKGKSELTLYARIGGYVQRWNKDLGDSVRKGDVLAVIDAPELEHSLVQTRATVEQIRARLTVAEASLLRWQNLGRNQAVSQQELDERLGEFQQATADLAAAEADQRRLEQLYSYRLVLAPFDGIITRRNVDVGFLVEAGNGGINRELFRIAQSGPLRIELAIPQAYTESVKAGHPAFVRLQEHGNQVYEGVVARSAGVIDSSSRAMLVEVEMPAQPGLMPGAYVQVELLLKDSRSLPTLPLNAVQFRNSGIRVAVVDQQQIRWQPVKLGRDLGGRVEIVNGISAQDAVVVNPPDAILEGETVVVKSAGRPAAAKPAVAQKT